MQSILKTCQPRPDILQGNFNPEIFTASLGRVMNFYQAKKQEQTQNIYTNAEAFFNEATYPTDGLKMVLSEVFGRLSGDASVPAIHRLETAFGGGKTHTLISLAHLGYRGKELSSVVGGLIDTALLPDPGEVHVVGIAGDTLAIHRSQGTTLVPYTLWGAIAYQIGGEKLYRKIETAATSQGAPGRDYLDAVFGGRKVLIMLDELAQYATRLQAAYPNGADNLASFLMGLHGYARDNDNVAVVLSLASQNDAFARQTQAISKLVTEASGKELSEAEAVGIAQQADKEVRSVVARDATTVVPVQATEISRVLAKRLFVSIDENAAQETADAYMSMYQKGSSSLPDYASRPDYRDTLVAYYPFHPRFIAFLNDKLATVENFQGTRGVLRVLALAVRNIWSKKWEIPMIHTCHLDVRDARTVNEIISRTGSGQLLPILNADVGSVDTSTIEGGMSNAGLADQRNPHPSGFPLYEYTWKTVFLHSLVGREQGLGSNLFGITEAHALLEVSFPGMTPPQIKVALDEIQKSAYYLRYHDGRYYAHSDPTINRALANIRNGLGSDEIQTELHSAARKIVKEGDLGTFWVEHDVSEPEHVPDKKNKPVLGIVVLDANEIDEQAFVTTVGPNTPRTQQNCVFLLVPKTVLVKGEVRDDETLFHNRNSEAQATMDHLSSIASEVIARRRLTQNPQNYGIQPERVLDEDFVRDTRERENGLLTAMTQAYDSVWYPSSSGSMAHKEIRTGGGEGGASVLENILQVLRDEGELITSEHAPTQEVLININKLIFAQADVIPVATMRSNFLQVRQWPILENMGLVETIVQEGVRRGTWCLFKMENPEDTRPAHFYGRDQEMPLGLDLTDEGWELVTVPGAKQRGWTEKGDEVDPEKVATWVSEVISEKPALKTMDVVTYVAEKHGEVAQPVVMDAIDKLVQSGRTMTYKGDVDQQETPDLISGTKAILYNVGEEDVIVAPAEAARRGWIKPEEQGLTLDGSEAVAQLVPMLRELSRLYDRGAKSKIDLLDLGDLEIPGGGRLRLMLTEVPADSMRLLGELLEVLADKVEQGEETFARLDIREVDENCALIKRLREGE